MLAPRQKLSGWAVFSIAALALGFFACFHRVQPNPFSYACTLPDNSRVTFGLIHSHPFIAEYDRFLEINGDRYHVGYDPGGHASIPLYKYSEDRFCAVTTGCRWIVFHPKTLTVEILQRNYDDVEPKEFWGIAKFVTPGHWEFVKAVDGEYVAPYWLKGG